MIGKKQGDKQEDKTKKLGALGKLILSLVESSVSKEAREKAKALAEGKEEPRYCECRKLKETFDDFRLLLSGVDPNGVLPDLLAFQYLLVVECETNEKFRQEKVSEYLVMLKEDLEDYEP